MDATASRPPVSNAALWFGLFGAPAIWSVQLLLDYPIVAHACFPQDVPLLEPVIGGARWMAVAIGIAALIGGVVAGWVAWQSWQTIREVRASRTAAPDTVVRLISQRMEFMAFSGVIVSALFILAIAMSAAAAFARAPCGGIG